MPRNGSGQYTLPPVYQATPGTTVRSEQHNVPLQDIEQAMTDSLPRSGSAPMTGNLAMGGRKVTGLGVPTSPTDAATKKYIDEKRVPVGGIDVQGGSLVGRPGSGTGAASSVVVGDGLAFFGAGLIANLGGGLSTVAGAIVANVKSYANQAQAEAATNNDTAMTPVRVDQYANANLLGKLQTWEAFTRSAGTIYTNTTGRPIMVAVVADATSAPRAFQVAPASGAFVTVGLFDEQGGLYSSVSAIIPAGHRYRIEGAATILNWAELR